MILSRRHGLRRMKQLRVGCPALEMIPTVRRNATNRSRSRLSLWILDVRGEFVVRFSTGFYSSNVDKESIRILHICKLWVSIHKGTPELPKAWMRKARGSLQKSAKDFFFINCVLHFVDT